MAEPVLSMRRGLDSIPSTSTKKKKVKKTKAFPSRMYFFLLLGCLYPALSSLYTGGSSGVSIAQHESGTEGAA